MDDDELCLHSLQMILELLGHECHAYHESLDVLRDFSKLKDVDAVIADLRMPKLDGLELIRKLKEQKPNLKALIVSGYSSLEPMARSMMPELDGYLHKPIDVNTVLKQLEKLLGSASRSPHMETKQTRADSPEESDSRLNIS